MASHSCRVEAHASSAYPGPSNANVSAKGGCRKRREMNTTNISAELQAKAGAKRQRIDAEPVEPVEPVQERHQQEKSNTHSLLPIETPKAFPYALRDGKHNNKAIDLDLNDSSDNDETIGETEARDFAAWAARNNFGHNDTTNKLIGSAKPSHGIDSQSTLLDAEGVNVQDLDFDFEMMASKSEISTPSWPSSQSPVRSTTSSLEFDHSKPLTACWAAWDAMGLEWWLTSNRFMALVISMLLETCTGMVECFDSRGLFLCCTLMYYIHPLSPGSLIAALHWCFELMFIH